MPSFGDLGVCYPIVTSIVNHLDKDDLPSFRLATLYSDDRCFFEIATHRLAQEFFRKVTVFMSRKSLIMLQEICAHSKFKHYIAQIEFASARLAQRYIKELDSSILETQPLDLGLRSVDSLGMSDLTRLKARYAFKFARQMAVAGRPAFIMLTDALRNLDGKVALSISGMVFSEDTPVLGSKSFCYEMECKPENVPCEEFRPGVYRLLVTAAVHVGMQVDTFQMNFDESPFMIDIPFDRNSGWVSQPTFKETLPVFCLGLKSFQLRVAAAMPDMWRVHLSAIQSSLALASQLEVLEISVCDLAMDEDSCNFLAYLLESYFSPSDRLVIAPNLQSLRLVGAVCLYDSIINFLAKHPKLRSIEIRACSLILGEDWSYILSNSIKPLRELESLVIEDLKRDDRPDPFDLDTNAGVCQCLPGVYKFNKETMAAGLDQLIGKLVAHGH